MLHAAKAAGTTVASALILFAGLAVSNPAEAGRSSKRTTKLVTRDCTPVNGPFGYYGNAWCDGGFLTIEEQEVRKARGVRIYYPDRRGYWIW